MRALKLIVVPLSLFLSIPAFAGNCKWNTTPSAMTFAYSTTSATDTPATTAFSFNCTPNSYGRLILTTGASGVFLPTRTMSGPATATYNVFVDGGYSQVWGDTTNGSVGYTVFNAQPGGKDFSDNMYGNMLHGQDLPVGTYTDTLFATLQYSNAVNGPWTSLAAVSMTVTATVVAECRVDAFNIDFGNYNPLSAAAVNQSTLLKVYCTQGGAPTSVTLNNGSNALGAQKRMKSVAGAFLNYTAALGSTAGTSTSILVPINNGFALNGTLAAQQDVATGLYQDTLTATVNY